MGRRDTGLLGDIEQQVLDSSVPIADVLRKCVILGGRAGSTALRDWASKELKGYSDEFDELPEYRKLTAGLAWNGIAGNFQVTAQPLGAEVIPEFAREAINNTVFMPQGIGEIEAMIANASGGDVKLQPRGADIVANYLNNSAELRQNFQQISAIYWSVSTSALGGIVDQVRTALAELVAEIRAGLPDDVETPSAALADQAVNVAIHGPKARVNISTAQASGAAAATVAQPATEQSGFWTHSRRIGAAIVGVATIVGTLVAVAQWQGWW